MASTSANQTPDGIEESTPEKTTMFKMQLDQAARDAQNPAKKTGGESKQNSPIVEKVSQFVPVVGKLLGNKKEPNQPRPGPEEIPGPPNRPQHDPQIEEFVRDQHRSKPGEALESGME